MNTSTYTYYGIIPQGSRKWAEVLVTKEPGQRSAQTETGVTYPSFRVADAAIAAKNRTLVA